MSRVVVAGAGASGVACAALLADTGLSVGLVERLPAAGGQEPEPETRRAASRLEARGVRLILATLAVSYDGSMLTTLGVGGNQRIVCDHLVVATGTRQATRGELGITGDRCAGVLPGSAMVHLLEVGVLPGRRPVVFGSGARALHCADLLRRGGSTAVTMVASDVPTARVPEGVELYIPFGVESVHGKRRISHVRLRHEGGGRPTELPTDALVLATRERPMLNVEGAIEAGPGVIFCQADSEDADPGENARRAADAVLSGIAAPVGARPSNGRPRGDRGEAACRS